MKEKDKIFQVLRGIACLYICLHHFSYFNKKGYGAIGVEFFFVLSGYLTAGSIVYKIENGYYFDKSYIIGKVINILIPYWIMTLLVFCVGEIAPWLFSSLDFNLSNLISSLLLVPGNTFYIYQGWTLTYMFVFYFVVYLVTILIQKKKHLIAKQVLLVVCGVLIGLILIGIILPGKGLILQKMKEYFSPLLLEFIIGILTYYLYENLLYKIQEKVIHIKGLQSIFWIMFILLIGGSFFLGWDLLQVRYIVPAIYVALVILVCKFLYFNDNCFLRVLEKIGGVSLYVYISHSLIIRPIDKFLVGTSDIAGMRIFGMVLGLVITVFFSFSFFKATNFIKDRCHVIKSS